MKNKQNNSNNKTKQNNIDNKQRAISMICFCQMLQGLFLQPIIFSLLQVDAYIILQRMGSSF